MHTLGARDFSLTVSGFCQAFIVTRKSMEGTHISNVLERFDSVDKLSDKQTSGVFNFIQRN